MAITRPSADRQLTAPSAAQCPMCTQPVSMQSVLRMSEGDAKEWLDKQQRQAHGAKKAS